MIAQPHYSRMSVEEYLALDRDSREARYEYIDGYAYMLAGGTRYHAIISGNVIGELRSALRGGPCRVYTSDAKVRLSKMRYVYPDITVSCDKRDEGEGDLVHYPHLIVEILSQSTEAYDRGDKFNYYRACSTIQEYVLVNTHRQAVEVYRRSPGKLWTLYPFGPGDQVELASIDISIPINSIYENITFPEDTAEEA